MIIAGDCYNQVPAAIHNTNIVHLSTTFLLTNQAI